MEPIIAVLYDFDRTLCTRDMQDYSFIPSIGMETKEFWNEANSLARDKNMDGILAYMYTMLKKARDINEPIRREDLVAKGHSIEFYDGVRDWFGRINSFGESCGVKIEHYVLSSGLTEIIEGSGIAKEFTKIFACEFLYNDADEAVWPKTAVNYTSKTQFVYRINKGILDISNDFDLNRSMPEEDRRVLFTNMIYLGDGMSDVPCMKMVKAYGGSSVAIYTDSGRDKAADLLRHGRVDFMEAADYREGHGLDRTIKNIIRKMAADTLLRFEHGRQISSLEDGCKE